MRLGKAHLERIDEVARKALAGECLVSVPAPTRYAALAIFSAATPHMEQRGARTVDKALAWIFTNGSRVVVSVENT